MSLGHELVAYLLRTVGPRVHARLVAHRARLDVERLAQNLPHVSSVSGNPYTVQKATLTLNGVTSDITMAPEYVATPVSVSVAVFTV